MHLLANQHNGLNIFNLTHKTVHIHVHVAFWSFDINLTGPSQASLQVLDENTTQLWWAGKELQRGKKLQDFIGKNEKTKLVCKLQKVRKIKRRKDQLSSKGMFSYKP